MRGEGADAASEVEERGSICRSSHASGFRIPGYVDDCKKSDLPGPVTSCPWIAWDRVITPITGTEEITWEFETPGQIGIGDVGLTKRIGHASRAYCICEPGVNCQQECAQVLHPARRHAAAPRVGHVLTCCLTHIGIADQLRTAARCCFLFRPFFPLKRVFPSVRAVNQTPTNIPLCLSVLLGLVTA